MKVRRVPVTTLPNFMCVAGKLVPLTMLAFPAKFQHYPFG